MSKVLQARKLRSGTTPDQSRTSHTELAYTRLREAIINLELRPGAMYSEAHLADHAGLGRTPVREGLQRLAREELVVPRKNRGILITPIDSLKQLQLLDVRRALEQLLARRSCERADPDERRRMLDLAQRMEETAADEDIQGFLAANRDVQDLKAKAAHNDTLHATMTLFFGLSRRYWVAHHHEVEGSIRTAATLHADILRAIALDQPETAARCSDALVDYLEDFARVTVNTAPRQTPLPEVASTG